MASLAMNKGQVRFRKMLDDSYEYVVQCHNDHISAMRLSDSGEYLATACEQGQFIRLWGWFESPLGQMETPVSLYMFEVGDRGSQGLVTNIQMTRNMTYIAASILKSVPKQDNQGLGDIEFDEE